MAWSPVTGRNDPASVRTVFTCYLLRRGHSQGGDSVNSAVGSRATAGGCVWRVTAGVINASADAGSAVAFITIVSCASSHRHEPTETALTPGPSPETGEGREQAGSTGARSTEYGAGSDGDCPHPRPLSRNGRGGGSRRERRPSARPVPADAQARRWPGRATSARGSFRFSTYHLPKTS